MNQVTKLYNEWIKLKDVLRAGWIQRNIGLDRTESVGDHVFSCAMLGWRIIEDKKLNIDLLQVLKILLIHELGEIYIGDLTPADPVSREDKYKMEYDAIAQLSKSVGMPDLLDLWLEFEAMQTEESRFAKKIDRLECVMQAKEYAKRANMPALYDEFYRTAKNQIGDLDEYLEE